MRLGVTVPAAYVAVLLRIGKDPGSFLEGSDLCADALGGLQVGTRALLDEADVQTLPEDAFVFCSHQGYQFLFFRLDGHPDPAVSHYLEGEREFRVVAASFSEWLLGAARDEFPDHA